MAPAVRALARVATALDVAVSNIDLLHLHQLTVSHQVLETGVVSIPPLPMCFGSNMIDDFRLGTPTRLALLDVARDAATHARLILHLHHAVIQTDKPTQAR